MQKTILTILAILPMICFGQNYVSLVQDTRGFYTSGWDNSKNGQPIKPFSMTTPDGKVLDSNDLIGKVIVLDFWSTWCSPCRELTKELNNMLQKYNGENFLMIGVNFAESVKKGNPVKYWQEQDYKFPMTINNDAYGKSIGAGNPTVIIIDQQGNVAGKFDALTDFRAQEIETIVWKLMEKPEMSSNEMITLNNNKEYVKAIYVADEIMKRDTLAGKQVISEKFKALLKISQWDTMDLMDKVTKESKDKELEVYLFDAARVIAQAEDLYPKTYAYGAKLFEILISKYSYSDSLMVNDFMGRCYFKSGDKDQALIAAHRALTLAEKLKQQETIPYLKGVLDYYNTKK
ncbi:thiol-disulfide isomerase/thioredoxin [Flavobacterium sp. 90]|uniref:TlpA family protein disulfide reductase n=1 Tax=unclassified Flavobacterium TaxID=196869 RepID=UPI000EB27F6C|nr:MULTISPECIES: TlpA disulfide reductase family protein [unclassified Flavobacterium]RKR08942.1 thiol-disulfide isomerase/thioredoxin [Flavobacterium sp. 81]TCK52730.1 thiol-disulfide isomerase/thioredoxin [Flavobacterium sp. 90]